MTTPVSRPERLSGSKKIAGLKDTIGSVLSHLRNRRAGSDRFQAAFDRTKGEAIFFLHIGKNAGTQIRQLCEQVQAKGHAEFVRVRHGDKFSVLPAGARYFFSVRSPSARFKSGFYSRKRKGAPRLYNEWSAHEAEAFAQFEHANDLAESLFEETRQGRLAWAAAQSITHTAMQQADWFSQHGFALDLHPPIWIIRQEHFNADFDQLLERAGISLRLADLEIAQDPKLAHSTNYAATPELSAKALAHLERWYARDFAFYDLCNTWIERNL